MVTDVLLGFDLGTSATKGIALSAEGEVLFQNRAPTRLLRPGPGRVEFDADAYFNDFCRLSRELVAQLPPGAQVRAVSMAAASGNTLLVAANGRPLTPVISWMDTRVQQEKLKIFENFDAAGVHSIAGWPFAYWFTLAHLAWFKEKAPDSYRQAARFCMNTNYVYYRLTGKWGVDYSTATPSYLQDQVRRRWHKPYLELLGIDESKLPRLYPTGTALGEILPAATAMTGLSPATKVVLGSFDHPAAARGTGTLEVGELLFSCGTSWVGFFPVRDRALPISMKILADPFLTPTGPWGAIFSLPCIGEKIDWYLNKYIAADPDDKYDKFNALAAAAPLGAGGLTIDLMAEPTPLSGQPEAGAVARAIMEGAAMLMRNAIEKFTGPGTGVTTSNINMVGGPTNSRCWLQIFSDVAGLAFKLSPYRQNAGALGAAIIAGIGSGFFKDEQAGFERIKARPEVIVPNRSAHEQYESIYQRFCARHCRPE